MSQFAVVALLPEVIPGKMDFGSKECEDIDGVCKAIKELHEHGTPWRMITVCHIEDLPLLMEPPKL